MHCAEIDSPSTSSAPSPPRRHRRRQWQVSHVQTVIVLDAPRHAPPALEYLRTLQNQSFFNFCTIPVPMAIATPEPCSRNPSVFGGMYIFGRWWLQRWVPVLSCSVGVEAGFSSGGASTALRLGVASRRRCPCPSLASGRPGVAASRCLAFTAAWRR
ncbi:hypothetical protein DFH09DRAFT_906629 [Mycena vulgaris]|nr:hypothetical protein DFH09DRAFT_906629 [Mycena vulgaris]